MGYFSSTICNEGGFIYWSQFFYIRAHNILWNDINNQLINHSDSLLITLRNLILDKFIKCIKCIDVKERKDQTESVQRIRIWIIIFFF